MVDNNLTYRTRHGDHYLHLAFVLEVTRDAIRDTNDLWRLQVLPEGQTLQIPLEWKGKHKEHTIKVGDDLEMIAKTYKSDPWRIIRDNSLFWDKPLTSGMVLKIRSTPPKPTYITHRVSSGDTLGALASRYGTTVRTIQNANNLGRKTLIRINQRLRITTRKTDETRDETRLESEPTYITHRVSRGDTLGALASRYSTTVRTIQNTNNLGRKTLLQIGQRLRIPTRKTDETRLESEPTYITHRVSRGDTLGALASRYSTTVRTIQNTNNLGRKTLLQIGQRLRIPTRKTG